jgi:hypothetical protein
MNLRSGKSINNETLQIMMPLNDLLNTYENTNLDDKITVIFEMQNFILNNVSNIKNIDYSLYISIRNLCNSLIKNCEDALISDNSYEKNILLKLYLLLNIVKSQLKLN